MPKIGLFYGSTTGNTADAAETIRQAFNEISPGSIEDVFDIAQTGIEAMADYDMLILGISTWDIGELQYDWVDVMDDLENLDLDGKKVAIFGLGDQLGFPDTFQDAIGMLGEEVRKRGAELVGFTSTEGFNFYESRGVENGQFMGLSLDEDNQPDLTAKRIKDWVEQLQEEFEFKERYHVRK